MEAVNVGALSSASAAASSATQAAWDVMRQQQAAARSEAVWLHSRRSIPFLMTPARQHFVIYELVPKGIAVLTVQHQVRD